MHDLILGISVYEDFIPFAEKRKKMVYLLYFIHIFIQEKQQKLITASVFTNSNKKEDATPRRVLKHSLFLFFKTKISFYTSFIE